ncbi:transferase hexapeptide (six repeat-containing protein) [Desulfomicrobium norvegicum]|uniref:Transferase hexapeptide (Six repeat-containing protein) n=1 Tax=Desulfomicrobium norvegicum (strain DSM 1741 / NCIMB 8310) TaxID=52561 RepID=A0A8G2F5P7_DESNO|nr:acyltransferase [Desulfomicrobium norvegicum]SFM08118.1 transferase hexapeptide (six repeat-containing protein) [Desulfomicrobium norvegicum]
MDMFQRVATDVELGEGIFLGPFINLYGCRIGAESKIGSYVEIQCGVLVGERCKISSHSFICEGVSIGDGVFVGHGVMFVNDRYPRAVNDEGRLETYADWQNRFVSTVVEDQVSIGTGAVILGGLRLGRGCLIGAGAVVTRDVDPGAVIAGNPARLLRRQGGVSL